MKKILVFILGLLCLFSCGFNQPTISEIKHGIFSQEKQRVPLVIQELDRVYDIQIDSIVLINDEVEPYYGYLVTTWDLDEKQNLSVTQWARNGYNDKYIRKKKQVLVEVNSITFNKKEGSISWKSFWDSAYYQAKNSD